MSFSVCPGRIDFWYSINWTLSAEVPCGSARTSSSLRRRKTLWRVSSCLARFMKRKALMRFASICLDKIENASVFARPSKYNYSKAIFCLKYFFFAGDCSAAYLECPHQRAFDRQHGKVFHWDWIDLQVFSFQIGAGSDATVWQDFWRER